MATLAAAARPHQIVLDGAQDVGAALLCRQPGAVTEVAVEQRRAHHLQADLVGKGGDVADHARVGNRPADDLCHSQTKQSCDKKRRQGNGQSCSFAISNNL